MNDMESLVIEDFFDENNRVQPASRAIEEAENPQIKAVDQGDSVRYLGEAEAVVGIDTFSIEDEFEWINNEDYELVVSVDVPQEEALEVFSKFGQDNTGGFGLLAFPLPESLLEAFQPTLTMFNDVKQSFIYFCYFASELLDPHFDKIFVT